MSKCIFCNGESKYIYNIEEYKISQCQNCKTCFVDNMPSDETLRKFYNGFKYCIDETKKEFIINKYFEKWFKSFHLPKDAKMLDIGGGNGYFSLAFEKYGFGKATYIDLDTEACNYAKTLNIHSVINDDVKNLAKYSEEKFDFIYSRHVIEHLKNPLLLIDAAIDLLSDDGVFVLQCPNGLTYENLIDIKDFENFESVLLKSNHIMKKDIWKILFRQQQAFGMAPPRHLWAISAKALECYLKKRHDVKFDIRTYGSRDKIYSPYKYSHVKKYYTYPVKYVLRPLKNFIRFFVSLPGGSSHLVVHIRKIKRGS